ncbi:P-loop containing nucleoside triphosphate hydrolase protein [Gymnopilus junonius]|uniref:Kinesin-like protein n=1 Tax=Gymnopilus junonius TaxID=109634 RepID=A0A9P5NVB9_GYMJU|nr:P-loop containing nucleoside triphosphate hydrolase protein [Gymnopilus junonius]
MSSKPAATRASTRTKALANAAPTATRTTRARTAKNAASSPEVPTTAAKKTVVRKPLASKDNSADLVTPLVKPQTKLAPGRKAGKLNVRATESEREPIMAYLRIRPRLGDEEPASSPYLTHLSDTTVNMTDPQDPQNGRSKYRFSTVPPSSIYTFSHIFPPNTTQSNFFAKTTLPLVQDVLMGQNGLLFTYGVTNSGKTYTVQGGTDEGAAGILPRSLDVIFSSIEGLHGDGRYRPVRLHGIELADDLDSRAPPTMPEPALADVLESLDNVVEPEFDVDPTVIPVDRNYEYTVWISYAEVYNEKVYDLLASVRDESNVHGQSANQRTTAGKPLLFSRQALPLRPSPTSDSMDTESSGKYVAGLRQFRVHSASQAKALVKLGQLHRRVFGTLANRESSRSHGMVIIKIVKGHRGERNNPTSLQVSRLTLVDLAGSERTKHTHTTGDRLKEAGNINKSLMVLGQCMEVMRSNQRKIAISLSNDAGKEGRLDTRDFKKGLAVVPFRHSKLTEVLMDYFVGEGRTVMIVNVNPYDTGYDENSHVMKFAALAREVYVTPAPAPVQRVPTIGPGSTQGKKIKQLGPLTLKDPEIIPHPGIRKVTISMGRLGSGKKPIEAILEVREDDEPNEEPEKDGEDDDPINPLVETLFDEIEHLRFQLFESEMRCALIEAETREEVMREMEERMRTMEQMYSRRLMTELERNELKTDAKIDMLHQSGLFGSPTKASRQLFVNDCISEEKDIEMSLIDYGEESGSDGNEGEQSIMTSSPWAQKMKPSRKSSVAPRPVTEKRTFTPDPPMLPSDNEDAQLTETESEISSIALSATSKSELNDEDDEDYTEDEDDEESAEQWEPSSAKTPRAQRQNLQSFSSFTHCQQAASKAASKTPRVSKLARDMHKMQIDESDSDESAIILPIKDAVKVSAAAEREEDDDFVPEVPIVKKKKRYVLGVFRLSWTIIFLSFSILNKSPAMTEDEINKVIYEAEKTVAKTQSATNRRFGK